MKFLKKVELKNGGYISNKKGNPVMNKAFYEAQIEAEYIVTLAEVTKDKTFEDIKGTTLDEVHTEVRKLLSQKDVKFINASESPNLVVTNTLKQEALQFIEHEESKERINKINKFMQRFTIINDYEKHGLFFEKGIQKLNKIYTVKEILNSVKQVIDIL